MLEKKQQNKSWKKAKNARKIKKDKMLEILKNRQKTREKLKRQKMIEKKGKKCWKKAKND